MKQELLTYIAIMILMKLCKPFSYIAPRTYDIVRGSIMMKNNLRKLVSLTAAAASSSSESIESAVTDDPVLDLLALELPTNDNSINLLKMRHTSAHVMAMAVQKVFPSVKVTIGPWIDNGYVTG
jgi:threonyl-tRNA synthetase